MHFKQCWKLWRSLLKKYQDDILCSFAYILVYVDDKFSNPIVLYRGEIAAYDFIEAILEEYEYCKKVMKNTSTKIWSWLKKKKIFNQALGFRYVKNVLMMTIKMLGIIVAAHWSCNINLQLSKKVPVIFHNLKVYDSYLIFYGFWKYDVKVYVIPNRLEKYMAFMINKNSVFIGSMQFMNSSLENLVKNLADDDFKYSTQEFGSKKLELFKLKDAYPHGQFWKILRKKIAW